MRAPGGLATLPWPALNRIFVRIQRRRIAEAAIARGDVYLNGEVCHDPARLGDVAMYTQVRALFGCVGSLASCTTSCPVLSGFQPRSLWIRIHLLYGICNQWLIDLLLSVFVKIIAFVCIAFRWTPLALVFRCAGRHFGPASIILLFHVDDACAKGEKGDRLQGFARSDISLPNQGLPRSMLHGLLLIIT